MRLVGVVDDERIARQILTHLGLPARAPPRGRRKARRGQLELAVTTADQEGIDPPLVLD